MPEPITLDKAVNQAAIAEAKKRIMATALLSLGVGAAARGGQSLYGELFGKKEKPVGVGTAEFSYPVPVTPSMMPKAAAARLKAKAASFMSFLEGSGAQTPGGVPYFYPGLGLAAAGGLALGYRGVDSAVKAVDGKTQESELERRRKAYHDALLGLYDNPLDMVSKTAPTAKAASDDAGARIGRALDAVYDRVEKAAAGGIEDMAGQAAGMYGMYALGAPLLFGSLAYNAAKKRNESSIVEEALKRRARARYEKRPTAMYAVPEAVTRIPAESRQEMLQRLANPGN